MELELTVEVHVRARVDVESWEKLTGPMGDLYRTIRVALQQEGLDDFDFEAMSAKRLSDDTTGKDE